MALEALSINEIIEYNPEKTPTRIRTTYIQGPTSVLASMTHAIRSIMPIGDTRLKMD
jgi:hypothetical protein